MAAVLAPSSAHPSSHFVPHRDTFAAFQQHRGPLTSHRNPFEAFSAHHHSGVNSRSAAASWRQSGPQTVARVPLPVDKPSPKFRRAGASHTHTPSTSSEDSSTRWRSESRSEAVTTVDVKEARGVDIFYFVLGCTLSEAFHSSPSIEGFTAILLFHRGAASPFSFTSRRYQQGVPGYSGRLSCPLRVAARCAFGRSEDGSSS